jgi:hypothetical protein
MVLEFPHLVKAVLSISCEKQGILETFAAPLSQKPRLSILFLVIFLHFPDFPIFFQNRTYMD